MSYIQLFSDAIASAQNRYAAANDANWITNAMWIEWINTAQYKINELACLLETDWSSSDFPPGGSPFVMAPGQHNYPLPLDFFRLKMNGPMTYVWINGNQKIYRDRTNDLEYDIVPGPPSLSEPENVWIQDFAAYGSSTALTIRYLDVFPVPDQAYISHMYYYRLPVEGTATTSVIDLGPTRMYNDVVVDFLVWRSAFKDKSPDTTQINQFFEKAMSMTYSESRTKFEGRPRSIRVGDYLDREF